MDKVFLTFRALCKQGFVPIFVKDDLDPKKLVEGCAAAGIEVIEYTLRRPDAPEMIPWIKTNFPELKILVGSVLDNERMVKQLRRHHPQLLTLEELVELGVNGFVSMEIFSAETIEKYSKTHLLVPCASTCGEAYELMGHGAHMIKFLGPDLSLVKRISQAPLHGFCSVFVTGGMNLERIPEAVSSGAVCTAAGFDLILQGQPGDISVADIASVLKTFTAAVDSARREYHPEFTELIDDSRKRWLDSLPFFHQFEDLSSD